MSAYKKEWIELLLQQKFNNWLIASDQHHIFINVPDDVDLNRAMEEFMTKIQSLRTKIKSKPVKLGFFIGNTKDSKFYELS